MPSTITAQAVANWAQPYLKNQPVAVSNLEPALSSAQRTLQWILAPPFRWPWNRATFTFQTELPINNGAPIVDYVKAIDDFGFIEQVYVTDGSNTPLPPLQVRPSLPVDFTVSRPTELAVQYDDGAGNLTFRLKNAPDKVYTISGDYQRKAPLIPCLAFTFGPVPDELALLFQTGFLAELSLLVNDARYPIFRRQFASTILSLQDGLDATAKSIFLEDYLGSVTSAQRAQGALNQGLQGRIA